MTSTLERQLIDEVWAALTGVSEHLPRLPEVVGDAASLRSTFAVPEVATACVAAALMAAAELHEQRNGGRPALQLDRRQVAAAVRSERYFEVDGVVASMGFAPLSRFWRTADGWIRTHANFPWHRDALLRELAVDDHDPDSVGDAIRTRQSLELEGAVVAAGGVAGALRDIDEWRRHPQGAAVERESLVRHDRVEGAPAGRDGRSDLPADGLRVLDLTRVIAGPVCTRFLGALGADVLRVDPPQRPDLAHGSPADTLLGKRSVVLDLSVAEARSTLDELLHRADLVVCGYRPGALERFGLDATSLVGRYPGLVVVVIDAWGHTGPWATRRGFDSVVQAVTGIAVGESVADESVDAEQPGALPCQLLDHGTGYLAAAAGLVGLQRQRSEGGSHICRLSLARTAAWLTSIDPGRRAQVADDPTDAAPEADGVLQELSDLDVTIRAVRPPGSFDGHPLQWPGRITRYGEDPASWAT
jgi:crotonobetainyl-CoA:carnitine CoA-transferase CaiB-like acyl-CoA transferase